MADIEHEFDGVLSESDEEELTARELLHSLERAWLDERRAPELLPHRQDRLECMLGQLQHMERNIGKIPPTELRHYAHKMEISRIKFIISSYLRTRLQKIEKFCVTLINEDRARLDSGNAYMTPAEYKYAQEYVMNVEDHMKTVLDRMPGNMQALDEAKMAARPELDAHVFVRARQTTSDALVLEGVAEDDDDILVNLEEGAQHIMQYRVVAELVKSGKVELI